MSTAGIQPPRSFVRVLVCAFLLAGLLAALVPAVSRAASFTVTNLDNDGEGSLRQALADAKAAAGDDTITFQDGLTGTITVTNQMVIDSNVTIQGPGADTLTVSGGNTTRVFLVRDGVTATIDGLTVSNGNANEGGGIHVVSSTLTITNSVFTGNGYIDEWGGWGGAIYASLSTVTVADSTFSDNTGYIGAAIHSGDSVLRIENTTVEHNLSSYTAGGLSSMGTGSATIVDSIFTNNEGGESGSGGGVYADTDLTVINSTFSNNDAGEFGWGGGIAMFGGDLAITGSSFIENTADASGGYGGAIFTTHDASLAITDSEFVENSGWTGGAIYVESDGAATTINSSTFERNHASDNGGAVYAVFPVNVTNSTFSGNTAKTGGGISSYHLRSAADNVVANSTFSGNSATDAGSSIAAWSGITITGSIFAGSSGVDSCSAISRYSNVGEVIDGGYNLSSDASCASAATSLANTDPLLGPLADNGGPMKTYALLLKSPALDRIPVDTLGCGTTLTTDQRGVERPQGTACDIGAFEALPDTSAPVITPDVNGALGSNGWYTGDVDVSWSVVDDESEITSTNGCDATTITMDTTGTTLTCEATSEGGTSSQSVTIKRDATGPVVAVTGIADGTVYTLGEPIPTVGCTTTDALSGVATQAAVSTTGGPVGEITVTCSGATDNAGNVGSASITYAVHYAWGGFKGVVKNQPKETTWLALLPVPVIFTIDGNQGRDAIANITSRSCSAAPGEGEVSAGSLFNIGVVRLGRSDQYLFIWTTPRSWARTCRVLTVTLADGTTHEATFNFK